MQIRSEITGVSTKVKTAFNGVQIPFWKAVGTVAMLAQMGEHLIYDQKVLGSNPSLGFDTE